MSLVRGFVGHDVRLDRGRQDRRRATRPSTASTSPTSSCSGTGRRPEDGSPAPTWTIRVGKKVEGTSTWYARRATGEAADPFVFTVNDYDVTDFRKDPATWVEKKPEPPAPAAAPAMGGRRTAHARRGARRWETRRRPASSDAPPADARDGRQSPPAPPPSARRPRAFRPAPAMAAPPEAPAPSPRGSRRPDRSLASGAGSRVSLGPVPSAGTCCGGAARAPGRLPMATTGTRTFDCPWCGAISPVPGGPSRRALRLPRVREGHEADREEHLGARRRPPRLPTRRTSRAIARSTARGAAPSRPCPRRIWARLPLSRVREGDEAHLDQHAPRRDDGAAPRRAAARARGRRRREGVRRSSPCWRWRARRAGTSSRVRARPRRARRAGRARRRASLRPRTAVPSRVRRPRRRVSPRPRRPRLRRPACRPCRRLQAVPAAPPTPSRSPPAPTLPPTDAERAALAPARRPRRTCCSPSRRSARPGRRRSKRGAGVESGRARGARRRRARSSRVVAEIDRRLADARCSPIPRKATPAQVRAVDAAVRAFLEASPDRAKAAARPSWT